MLIATHSGLRGRPGTELTDALIDETVGGFLALLSAGGLPERVAVASDERATSAVVPETGPGRDGLEAGLVAMELMARTGAAAAAEPHDELVGVL